MNEREAFLAVAKAHRPDDPVSVPAGVLVALLEGGGAASTPSAGVLPTADLTVADLAGRYARKPSTARAWVERGLFPGAYRLRGRDWRVPPSGVEAFDQRERQRGAGDKSHSVQTAAGRPVDLGRWRRRTG